MGRHDCEESEKGRETFRYMPDVRRRLEEDWKMEHYQTQFLTTQGNFRGKLRKFNLVEEETCECGRVETVSHSANSARNSEVI